MCTGVKEGRAQMTVPRSAESSRVWLRSARRNENPPPVRMIPRCSRRPSSGRYLRSVSLTPIVGTPGPSAPRVAVGMMPPAVSFSRVAKMMMLMMMCGAIRANGNFAEQRHRGTMERADWCPILDAGERVHLPLDMLKLVEWLAAGLGVTSAAVNAYAAVSRLMDVPAELPSATWGLHIGVFICFGPAVYWLTRRIKSELGSGSLVVRAIKGGVLFWKEIPIWLFVLL